MFCSTRSQHAKHFHMSYVHAGYTVVRKLDLVFGF